MDIMTFGRKSFVTWTTGLKEGIQKAEKENQMKKYRGLTKEGKWVYGWYLVSNEKHYIVDCYGVTSTAIALADSIADFPGYHEVIPETIGQFTGLKDKNGKEIYADDKLQDSIDDDIGKVYWKESAAGFYCLWGDGSNMSLNYGVATVKCEIIGNIYPTPELLERIK